jgi:CRP-like cAMP-binding protein
MTMLTKKPMATTTLHPTVSDNLIQRMFHRTCSLPLRQDTLWRIERGVVRTITWNESGTLITLGYWGPGELVGRPLSQLDPYSIECLTDVQTSLIPSSSWPYVLDAILSSKRETEEILSIARHDRINQRLLHFLGYLARKFGQRTNEGLFLDLPLTHEAIAVTIGTTRITITRLLKLFAREGIIKRHRRQLVLSPAFCAKPID